MADSLRMAIPSSTTWRSVRSSSRGRPGSSAATLARSARIRAVGVAVRSHQHERTGARDLLVGNVERGTGLTVEPVLGHVLDDSHHGQPGPGLVRAAPLHLLAEGIPAGPQPARHAFAHDSDRRRIGPVRERQSAPGPQLDAQGAEVPGADRLVVGHGQVEVTGRWSSADAHRSSRHRAEVPGKVARPRPSPHARNLRQVAEQASVKIGHRPARWIARVGQPQNGSVRTPSGSKP